MPMPQQKPGNSKQDWRTPHELVRAVKNRLNIRDFAMDVAANEDNALAEAFYDADMDGLTQPWERVAGQWNWCNPPYADINPWVCKAFKESRLGASSIVLIPHSIAQWWVDWVEPYAYIVELHGRIKFVGAEQGYPKDCALLFYTPFGFKGREVWNWKRDVPQLLEF